MGPLFWSCGQGDSVILNLIVKQPLFSEKEKGGLVHLHVTLQAMLQYTCNIAYTIFPSKQ